MPRSANGFRHLIDCYYQPSLKNKFYILQNAQAIEIQSVQYRIASKWKRWAEDAMRKRKPRGVRDYATMESI
jgi:hypothetical protein